MSAPTATADGSKPLRKTFRTSLQETLRTAAGNLKGKGKEVDVLRPDTTGDGVEGKRPVRATHSRRLSKDAPDATAKPPPLVTRTKGLFSRRSTDSQQEVRLQPSSPVPLSPVIAKGAAPPGWGGFSAPTLSHASMSSPTLPLHSNASLEGAGPSRARAPEVPAKTGHVSGVRPRRLTARINPSSPDLRMSGSPSPNTSPRDQSRGDGTSTARVNSVAAPLTPLVTDGSHPSRLPHTPSPTRQLAVATEHVPNHVRPPRPTPGPPSSFAGRSPPTSPVRMRRSTSATPPPQSPIARGASPIYSGLNSSASSVSSPSRDAVRLVSSYILKEFVRPLGGMKSEVTSEIERRLRPLARLERLWGKSGSGGYVNPNPTPGGGEERERRAFSDALRDGFVLCHLMNRFQPGAISRIDEREDGLHKTTNIPKFLKAASRFGVAPNEIFHDNDLLEASQESLIRVAETVMSLSKLAEASPYHPYATRRGAPASISSPNLFTASSQRRHSPPSSAPFPAGRFSPSTSSQPARQQLSPPSVRHTSQLEEPPPLQPAPPSPSAAIRSAVRSETKVSHPSVRISLASTSAGSDTTAAYSSLLDSKSTKYDTVRTMTTEATSLSPSDAPSFTRSEASFLAQIVKVPDRTAKPIFSDEQDRLLAATSPFLSPDVPSDVPSRPARKERRSSEIRQDLDRVAEEGEEHSTVRPSEALSNGHKLARNLRKGNWPDDFEAAFRVEQSAVAAESEVPFGLLPAPVESCLRVSPAPPMDRASPQTATPLGSANPSAARPVDDGDDTIKATVGDVIPSVGQPSALFERRAAGKAGPRSIGVSMQRSVESSVGTTTAALSTSAPSISAIPFPQEAQGHGRPLLGRAQTVFPQTHGLLEKGLADPNPASPKFPLRARRRSELETPLLSRSDPYDDVPGRVRRQRHESMISLGATQSISDAGSRDSSVISGATSSGVRRSLTVREEGRPPTHYQLGNCIGRGQFGSVYRALNLNTGQTVAVKRIRLEGHSEAEVTQLMKEVDLLKSLSHPSIVRYEGMLRDVDTLNIVLEYVENGSLGQTLKAFGKLNERLVASYVAKILEGLHYLHQCEVVHCDLKAANILTTKNGNIKLSDFGVSLNLRAMENIKNDAIGTPNWMAPEVIELKGASPASDIWSLGCTIIELLTGRPPYPDIHNGLSVMFRIVDGDGPDIPEECSDSAKDFLRQCFRKDPLKRPSAELLFEHEWLKQDWGVYKELRPQDSIPFLRRVSAEVQRSELARQLSFMNSVDSPQSGTPPRITDLAPAAMPFSHSPRTDHSGSSSPAPREHSFVKTTFSKAVVCRVCGQLIQKTAVLCEECSLISHSRCAEGPLPPCFGAQPFLHAGSQNHVASPPVSPSATSSTAMPSLSYFDPSMSSSPPLPSIIFPWKRARTTTLEGAALSPALNPTTMAAGPSNQAPPSSTRSHGTASTEYPRDAQSRHRPEEEAVRFPNGSIQVAASPGLSSDQPSSSVHLHNGGSAVSSPPSDRPTKPKSRIDKRLSQSKSGECVVQ